MHPNGGQSQSNDYGLSRHVVTRHTFSKWLCTLGDLQAKHRFYRLDLQANAMYRQRIRERIHVSKLQHIVKVEALRSAPKPINVVHSCGASNFLAGQRLTFGRDVNDGQLLTTF